MNLHIVLLDKFIPKFIEFMETNVDEFERKNLFWMIGDADKYVIRERENIDYDANYCTVSALIRLSVAMHKADKIILHGLFLNRILFLLAFQPWLLKKSYWIIWGGDLYREKAVSIKARIIEYVRAPVIKRMGHLISYLDEDIRLARHWYGCEGRHHHSFFYPSNLFKQLSQSESNSQELCIQVGNSADPSNNHLQVFDLLKKTKLPNFRVLSPLSYGNRSYAKHIECLGQEYFGENFTGYMEMMPVEEYLDFLQSIDVAIFNHKRQQAMGNMITLLGFGRKVYMRSSEAPFLFFEKIGVKVFDVDSFNGEKLSVEDSEHNKKVVSEYFSEKNLSKQLNTIFN
jgi:hypothetical protein